MSASREKHNRREAGRETPRTAREAEQLKAEKRANRVYIAVAVAFVLVAALTLIWKTNILQKSVTAVTIGDESYTAAEVNYYYQNEYQYFVNNYYSYLSMFGLDISKDLKSQECAMGEEGESWYDYFLGQALNQMISDQAVNTAADDAGYDEWNDSLQSSYDSAMASLEETAESNGYSVKEYLKLVYGGGMTTSTYEGLLKNALRAQAYATEYADSLDYTTEELTEAYEADPNSYDLVSYESVLISGAVADTDDEGNEIEVTDEMKQEAMDTAKASADKMLADFKAGSSLSDLADANDAATYSSSEEGTYSSSVLNDWLFDESRKAGDSAVLEDADNSRYYVVSFKDRYREEYNTIDVRHILLQIDTSSLDSESDTYEEDLQALKDEKLAEAEELLEQWKSGEATEESFANLANEKSEDGGSNTNGGLYTRVHKGDMVEEFNDWCFDPARKSGDTGIVYGESSSYKGYHIMYFVGTNLPGWQADVFDNLQNEDYTAWHTDLTEAYTAEQHSFGMNFVG
jgi:parvulin-like peptidyl-prolyl isomerase